MSVLETKIGGYSAPNIGYVRRLYLLDREQCVAVLDPLRHRYVGASEGHVPLGGVVATEVAELISMQFAPKGCTFSLGYTPNGSVCTVSCDLPGTPGAIQNFYQRASHRQYVCLLEDNNGRAYVLGNEERGLRLRLSQSVGSVAISQLSLAGTLNVPPFQVLAGEGLVLAQVLGNPEIRIWFSLNYIPTTNSMYRFQTFNILGVRRGDSFQANFQIAEDIDLTGLLSVRSQVRRYPSDYEVLLTLDTEIDGQYLMLSKIAQDMLVPAGSHYYDVEFTETDGTVYTLFGGSFQILNDVSR